MEETIARLRKDVEQYRNAYKEASRELAQARAEVLHWKAHVDVITARSVEALKEMDAVYQKAFRDTIDTVKMHPTGGCKDCDLNALAAKIGAISQERQIRTGKFRR